MKRSDSLISVVMALLFAATLLYFGVFLMRAVTGNSVDTVTAESVSQKQSVQVQGVVIREERPLTTAGIEAEPVADDGQAVAAGAVIANAGGRLITAPESGLYVREIDGYEHLTPGILDELTVSGLDRLLSDRDTRACPAGKLITSFAWYFACSMEEASAGHLAEGVSADLIPVEGDPVSAVVIHISSAYSGRCAVVFRCTTGMQQTIECRELTAEILPSYLEGLLVPNESIHCDDNGNRFVYVLSASHVEKKYVNILSEDEESSIVSEDSSADGLHAGNQIIVSSPDDLQEGLLIP